MANESAVEEAPVEESEDEVVEGQDDFEVEEVEDEESSAEETEDEDAANLFGTMIPRLSESIRYTTP